MVNDLNTLSGALVECKDQLISELENKGVTATYDPTTGLLGLISHIADIQGGEAILLTTDKNILSYYNSETATLTAVHSGGSGKSLSVYNAVSGSKIGDMTDNSDGTYSYTYNSTGVGDISMTCATTTSESNSITIEDCTVYDTTNYNSVVDVHYPLPNTDYVITFETFTNSTAASYNQAHLDLGVVANRILCGVYDSNRRTGLLEVYNGSVIQTKQNSTASVNTHYTHTVTYQNGVFTHKLGNDTVTLTPQHTIPSEVTTVRAGSYQVLNKIKVKPIPSN